MNKEQTKAWDEFKKQYRVWIQIEEGPTDAALRVYMRSWRAVQRAFGKQGARDKFESWMRILRRTSHRRVNKFGYDPMISDCNPDGE